MVLLYEDSELVTPAMHRRARGNVLAQLGGRLLAAGAPTTDPGYGRRQLGQALAAMPGTYADALDNAMRRKLLGERVRESKAERERRQKMRELYDELIADLDQDEPGRRQVASALEAGGGPTPRAAGLLDEDEAAPGSPLLADLTPAQRSMLKSMPAEEGLDMLARHAFRKPSSPTVRDFKEGDQVVTRQLVPGEGWVEVSRAPRWEPDEGGDITEAQKAQNAEIEEARRRLADLQERLPKGSSLSDELMERMSKTDPMTGLPTPDYQSYWGRLGWLAMQRKVGEPDREQSKWSQRLMGLAPGLEQAQTRVGGGAAAVEPGPPGVARGRPRGDLPSPVRTAERGGGLLGEAGELFDRGYAAVTGLLSEEAPAASPTRPAPATAGPPRPQPKPQRSAPRPPRRETAAPQPGETITVRGKAYEVVRRNPDGTLVVRDPDTGREFVARRRE